MTFWAQQLCGCLSANLHQIGVDTSSLVPNPPTNRIRDEYDSICKELSQSSLKEVLLQRRPMYDCRPSWSNESGPVHLIRSRRGYSCWNMRTSAHKDSWKLWVKFEFNKYTFINELQEPRDKNKLRKNTVQCAYIIFWLFNFHLHDFLRFVIYKFKFK